MHRDGRLQRPWRPPATRPREPLFGLQWDMTQIDVPAAHAVTTGSPNVVVGVLDSGISSTHPDLATQIAKDKSASCLGGVVDTSRGGVEPDDLHHGTHVAGTIAGGDQRRRHRRCRAGREGGIGEGRRRRRLHLPRGRRLRLPLGGRPRHADHEQQLLHRPVGVQLPQRRRVSARSGRPSSARSGTRRTRACSTIASAGNSNVDLQHKFIDAAAPTTAALPSRTREINGACLDLPAEAPGVVTVSAVGTERLKSYYSSYGQGVVGRRRARRRHPSAEPGACRRRATPSCRRSSTR